MGIYLKSVRDYRCRMKLKNAQKNVHDALFFGHDSGGLRLLMFIQDGKIWVQTFKSKIDNRKLIGVRYRFIGVIPRIETDQIRIFSITDLQFVFFADIIIRNRILK